MKALSHSLRSLAPLILGFLLLFASLAGAVWLFMQQQNMAGWVQHTLEVENRLGRIQTLAADAESGQRGYLVTGQRSYLVPYAAAKESLIPEINALRAQTSDNPVQQRRIPILLATSRAKLVDLDRSVRLTAAGQRSAALPLLNDGVGQRLSEQMRHITNAMHAEERRLLIERANRAASLSGRSLVVLLASAILVTLLAFLAIRNVRQRLRDVQDANARLREESEERKAAEGQVRQLQKMEAIGQLTGGIAHDFNNMLAIVVGSLDLARRRLVGTEHPNIAKCIDNAAEGAQRAAVLTARLLAFSRQQPLDPKVLDANKLVGGMSELLRRTIGEPIRIETVLAGGLWRVRADATEIENALVNLAVNGRDAMPDGGKLTIETANCDLDDRYARAHVEVTAGQYVMISVSDSGVGMPAEVIERAFDPFYTTKGVGKGTGLGLSQVFGFLKQSKGHVKIYSEVGHGTTIKLYLPRYSGTDTTIEAAVRREALPVGTADEIVLVVEDEAGVRHVSVDALRELGYTVIQAASPNEALQQLAVQPHVTLMFTDIVMPDMTGRQLAEKALEQRPDLKVLYTTGYTRNSIVHNGVLDPGTAFLAKPFTIEQLAAKIREVLDKS